VTKYIRAADDDGVGGSGSMFCVILDDGATGFLLKAC
jgi:hypothetical protein